MNITTELLKFYQEEQKLIESQLVRVEKLRQAILNKMANM